MRTPVQIQIRRDVQDHASRPDRPVTRQFAAPAQREKARFTAYHLQAASLVAGLFFTFAFAFAGGVVQAQGASDPAAVAPLVREQVKMERDEFISTHQWDDIKGPWVEVTP